MFKTRRFLLISFFILEIVSMPAYSQTKAYEWIIRNALVYDGESARPVQTDVAIHGDRIAAVGKLSVEDAENVIDAEGLILMPGLIDAHTHTDFNSWIYPDLANKLYQGVTTEITGNCGMSAAPVEGEHKNRIRAVWAREGVTLPGGDLPWSSVQEYRQFMEKNGLVTNLGVLVGHGNVRSAVMGFEDRPASPEEIKSMQEMLAKAMDEGALGISFGLVYLPGIFAREEELKSLCKTAGERGGVCAFHMRSEGRGLVEAVKESIRIGEASGARVELSHLKAAGPANWEKIDEAFRIIEAARARGVQVRADAYPYDASFAELGVVLPDELYKREDRDAFFTDPAQRPGILKELEAQNQQSPRDWSRVMVASVTAKEDEDAQGKTIQQIAAARAQKPEEVLLDLLVHSHFEVSAFYFSQSPAVVEKVLAKEYVTLGSDSIADGIGHPHPRAFGSFPKVLRAFMKGNPEAMAVWVRKTTAETADYFRLKERGRIAPGNFADLVLFSPEKTRDLATYEAPSLFSQGAEWVFVNGEPVIARGAYKVLKNGRILGR